MGAMSIFLASDLQPLLDHVPTRQDDRLIALLYAGDSALCEAIQAHVADPLIIDVEGPRLSRVNFDAVGLVILDLAPAQLLSSGGRRLVDVLGRLAEEALDLALVGPATAVAGSLLQDGVTAALNLIPSCVVIDDVQAVDDLHGFLARVSLLGVRLLALDGPVLAQYSVHDDHVTVSSDGNVMLVAFVPVKDGSVTARAQILHKPMRRSWPD